MARFAFKYSLKTLMIAATAIAITIACYVTTANRDVHFCESRYVGLTGLQVVYATDRWRLREPRLEFLVIIRSREIETKWPGIWFDNGHAKLKLPDGQVMSPEQSQLLELDADSVRRFDERITWAEWQHFQEHQKGGFRMEDLLQQVQAERSK